MSSRTGTPHIFRSDRDGTNVRQLTVGAGEFQPSCSSDGSWLAYGAKLPNSVWRISIDGVSPVRILEKFGLPSVSPDGRQILIEGGPDDPTVSIAPAEPGATAKPILVPASATNLTWSRDGAALLYIGRDNDVGNVWRLPLESGPPRRVTNFQTDTITSFAESRGGRQLAVARRTATVNDVVLIRDVK